MHVLVVDDQQEVRDLLRQALERTRHRVTLAATLEEAGRCVDADPPDVIVLDLALPDGTGLELCRQLRERKDWTPILMLTAHGEVRRRVEGLDAGADDFLSKPFAVAELRARVRALHRRGPIPRRDTIQIGSVLLDLGGCIALRDGKEAAVTGREWSILEFLAARRGRVVSRGAILDAVWGEATDQSNASLEVLVGRIRRKLGAHVIRTVRGEGYALGSQ
ncbi:MAG: response regulator transcription factor [Deltaproteobacteria bacterium]|nr:response regulator transcription factor [Deltaproteobacteria bacterium]